MQEVTEPDPAKREIAVCGRILSLVAKPILTAAIGTLPGNSVAGHAPDIFLHTFLAYAEPAPAGPAKRKRSVAAMALSPGALAAFGPVRRFNRIFFHLIDQIVKSLSY